MNFLLSVVAAIATFAIHGSCTRTIRVSRHRGDSIQAAIKRAHPGDTILVGPGTYNEQVLITKDGISLIGQHAVISPPASLHDNRCTGFFGTGTQAGICIAGFGVEATTFEVEHRHVTSVQKPVKGVSVSGFTVQNFHGANILVIGAENTRVHGNRLVDGDMYGFLTAGSAQTSACNNTVTSSQPFGFIAMCMDNMSDVVMEQNEISTYIIGFCVQTNGAQIRNNRVTNSCVGAFVDPFIDSAELRDNVFSDGNGLCTDTEKKTGAAAIVLDGTTKTKITENVMKHFTGPYDAALVVLDDSCSNPDNPELSCLLHPGKQAISSGNIVQKNTFQQNTLDIFVNTTGVRNHFRDNRCRRSQPKKICARHH